VGFFFIFSVIADFGTPERARSMDINETPPKERNAKQEKRHHFKWLKEHLRLLGADIRQESRKIKFWLEIAALTGLAVYTVVTSLMWRATEKAAEAAKTANESFISTQRAFVNDDQMIWYRQIDGTRVTGWLFYMPWKNSGITPAIDAKCFINILQGTGKPVPSWFPFPDVAQGNTNEFVLGPQQTKQCGPLFVPADQILKVPEPNRHTFFYGWVTYCDIFKHSDITRFSTELTGIIGSDPLGLKASPGCRFKDWMRFNCADEQCERQEAQAYAEMPPEKVLQFPRQRNPHAPKEPCQ
jgi:hypothetical protein